MNKNLIEKYKENLKELIEEGKEIEKLEEPTKKDPELKTIRDGARLEKWRVKTENAISLTFGGNSVQYLNYLELKEEKPGTRRHDRGEYPRKG